LFAILLHGQSLPDTYEQSAKSVTLDMAIPSLNLPNMEQELPNKLDAFALATDGGNGGLELDIL